MKKFRSTIFILMIISLIITAGCGDSTSTSGDNDGILELKLGHISVEDYTYHYYALKFKELVEDKTNGKVEITIYPNSLLGQNRELVESIQSGNLDLAALITAATSNFVHEFGILDIPYLFDDWDHVKDFCFSDTAKELLSKSDGAGIKSFSLGPLGFRHLTTSVRPVYTPDDLNNIKIRVIESAVYVDTFKELGAIPNAMSWGDAFTAMQQGAIDAQENDPSVIYNQGVYDVQDYVSLTGHIFSFFTLNASKKNYDQWPEDVQIAIQEAAIEANEYIFDKTKNDMDGYLIKLEEKGMEINEVDKESFRNSVLETQKKYREEFGEDLYDKIKNLN